MVQSACFKNFAFFTTAAVGMVCNFRYMGKKRTEIMIILMDDDGEEDGPSQYIKFEPAHHELHKRLNSIHW